MPKPALSPVLKRVANNTVKLPVILQRRVLNAMSVEGFTVWSEFCRVALTDKCHHIEDRLRGRDPGEFQRIYGTMLLEGTVRAGKAAPAGPVQ